MSDSGSEENKENLESYDTKRLFQKKLKIVALGAGGVLLVTTMLVLITRDKKKEEVKPELETIQLDAGTAALNTDKVWRHNVEENMSNQQKSIEAQLEEIKNELAKKHQEEFLVQEKKYRDLEAKFNFMQAELGEVKTGGGDLKIENTSVRIPKIGRHIVNLSNGKNSKEYEPLKTPDNYIAAGSFAKAALLTGLDVSTAPSTINDPEPILLKITDHGTLPRRFKSDLKECHLLGAAHGQLSGVRAKIRLEKLSCVEIKTGEIIETEVAGYISGEDGRAGLRGTLIEANQKYLMNAQIFGTLAGISKSSIKDAASYNPFTIGMGAVKPLTGEQKLQNNLMDGAGSSLDRLSNYYIDQAESMSPVVDVAAGRKVNVVFTEGVFFGTSELKKSIAKKRDVKIKNVADSANTNTGLMERLESRNE